jgi:hypothetical protein
MKRWIAALTLALGVLLSTYYDDAVSRPPSGAHVTASTYHDDRPASTYYDG